LTGGVIALDAKTSLRGQANRDTTFVLYAATNTDTEPDNPTGQPLVVTTRGQSHLGVGPGRYIVTARRGIVRRAKLVEVSSGSVAALSFIFNTGLLRLTATGMPPRDASALKPQFRVLEADPDAPGGLREVARASGERATLTLPAGSYTIEARLGAVQVRQRVAVQSGADLSERINLRATGVTLNVTLPAPLRALNLPISHRIYAAAGTKALIARTNRPRPTLTLPAARYRIETQIGNANVRHNIDVDLTDGTARNVTITPLAGLVRLSMETAPGQLPAGDIVWMINDLAGRTLWQSGEASPTTALAPGRYAVRAETLRGEVTQEFEVLAGQRRRIALQAPR
ncbi:MAG: hypothetical protein AAFR04_12225, partial [Pseudomonadota bacterium]